MTWNSKQIQACINRIQRGDFAGINSDAGAPFDVVMSYGAWNGTPCAETGPGVALNHNLYTWLKRVLAEEEILAEQERLAGTPKPRPEQTLPNGATVIRHVFTQLRRGDGTVAAKHDGSAPDDVLIVFDDRGSTMSCPIDLLERIVAMARDAQALAKGHR